MPLYDCGDNDCEECQREFGPNREKAIRNFEAREAFQARTPFCESCKLDHWGECNPDLDIQRFPR